MPDAVAAQLDYASPPAPAMSRRSPALFAWALVTTLAMFPLIWMGGLVTSHGAGMSVPDWPNTFGYNMFAVPWADWLGSEAGGVFYEHTHRLLGSAVGFFALVTVASALGVARHDGPRRWQRWIAGTLGGGALAAFIAMKLVASEDTARHLGHLVSGFGGLAALFLVISFCRTREPRAWVRGVAFALLVAVVTQGILGGLRVVLVNLDLAVVHGIFGQLTFCLGGFLCLAASRWWLVQERTSRPALTWPALVLVATLVAQLAIAAAMRHYGAGLAVPDFPLHYGKILPPIDADSLAAANAVRAWDYQLENVTLAQVWLHMAHRIGAVIVTLATVWVVWRLWRAQVMRGHAVLLAALVLVQATLGVLTVWMQKPADIATLHVATGAVLLLTAWLLAAKLVRRYGWLPATNPHPARPVSASNPSVVQPLAAS